MKKTVFWYGMIWLVSVLALSAAILLFAGIRERNRIYQFGELLERHPQLESELAGMLVKEPSSRLAESKEKDLLSEKYGYDFLAGMLDRGTIQLWAVLAAITTMAVVCIGIGNCIREKHRQELLLEQTSLLCEQLGKFRAGEFQIEDSGLWEGMEDSGVLVMQWMKLWENIRETGAYFGDLKEKLQTEEESTKALITNISHQLKTPLASLRMSHELVLAEVISEEEKNEFLAQEEFEINRLEMLLEELMNLSRLENHMIQIHMLPCSIKQTIAGAVSQIYRKAADKKIEISLEMEEDFTVCHDMKWTGEALSNILDNAVKYSGTDTRVEIRVQKMIKYVKIEIADEGMGIPKEELHRIYQRFYRCRQAAGKVKEGAGVGLYLARMIIEQQKGIISAKNRSGGGTVFIVMLPFTGSS